MHNYVVFDLETTGLSHTANEIIEIGAWLVKDDIPVRKFSSLVKPNGYLSRDIQIMTGITPSMLEDACKIDEVLPVFMDFCEEYPLLCHNIDFDYTFAKVKAKALGYDFSLGGKRTGIDTLKLCRTYYKGKSHKLSAMADYFGINISSPEGFHRATYDAYITKLIYDRFLVTMPNSSMIAIPELLESETKIYGKADSYGVLKFN